MRLGNEFPGVNCKRTGFILPAASILTYCPCGCDKALTWLPVTLSPGGEGNVLRETRLPWSESGTGQKHPEPLPRAPWQSGRIFCRGFISITDHRSVP